eukprot:scaffold197222_cov30-Prasinocladus_malaysianus.AAC.1
MVRHFAFAILLHASISNHCPSFTSITIAQSDDLERLEAKLKEPDAILEPQILDTLRRYVMKGGEPQTVVAVLSDNYAGKMPPI